MGTAIARQEHWDCPSLLSSNGQADTDADLRSQKSRIAARQNKVGHIWSEIPARHVPDGMSKAVRRGLEQPILECGTLLNTRAQQLLTEYARTYSSQNVTIVYTNVVSPSCPLSATSNVSTALAVCPRSPSTSVVTLILIMAGDATYRPYNIQFSETVGGHS